MTSFTTPPLLVAMIVAIASMPTNVYKVCAWNVGTVKTEPWRAKAQAVVRRGRTQAGRWLAWFWTAGEWRLAAAVGLLMVMCLTPVSADALLAVPLVAVPGDLKALRERAGTLAQGLLELKQKRAQIGNTAGAENRSLTEEERAAFFTDIPAQISALEAQVSETAEFLAAAEAATAAERDFRDTQPDPDQLAADAARQRAGVADGVPTVAVGRDRADEDAMRGFKSPRHFLSAVMRAGRTGHVDDLLNPLRVVAAAGADEQRSDQGEHGGFLVPTGLSPTLLQLRPQDDPVAELVFAVPMETPTRRISGPRGQRPHHERLGRLDRQPEGADRRRGVQPDGDRSGHAACPVVVRVGLLHRGDAGRFADVVHRDSGARLQRPVSAATR